MLRSFVSALAICVSTSALAAETLEQSYARQCSGAAKASEACVILRKALQEKLAAEDAAEPAAPKSATAKPVGAANAAEAWGHLAALPDSGVWYVSGAVRTWSWVEKNRVLQLRDEVSAASETYTLLPDGTIEVAISNGSRWKLTQHPKGPNDRFVAEWDLTIVDGSIRRISTMADGKIQTVVDWKRDGQFTRLTGPIEERLLTDQELANAREFLKQAATPESIRTNWGVLASFAGKTYVHTLFGLKNVRSYEWAVPGVSMVARYAGVIDRKLNGSITPDTPSYVIDPLTRKLSGVQQVQPDGTLLMPMGEMRQIIRLSSGGYEELTEKRNGDGWKKFNLNRYMATRQDSNIENMVAELTATKEKKSGGNSWLGAVAGAVGGAAAGAAFGGSAEVIAGGAAKGAAMFSNGAAASALNSTGDSLMGAGGVNTALPKTASASSGGGASYPTRPNVLATSAACSMMNESNYRQVGVEGGNDVQLKTMCAQAYEYYTMYKRAISQGYAEADANRTYDAHQKAAQNAISFYVNNRG